MRPPAVNKLFNAGWFILERGIRVSLAFFVMTLVARHMGPSVFGAYAFIFSVPALLLPFSRFGLDSIIMRRCVSNSIESKIVLGSAIMVRCIGASVGMTIGVAFAIFFEVPEGVTPQLLFVSSLLLFVAPAESFNAWFKANEQMACIVVPRIAIAFIISGGAFYLVSNDGSLEDFVMLRGGEAFFLVVAAVLAFSLSTGSLHSLKLSRSVATDILREGWPLMLSSLAVTIYMRSDQIMLGLLSNNSELGKYSIAVRITDIVSVVPFAIHAAFFRSAVRVHTKTSDQLFFYMQRIYDAMGISSIVLYFFIIGVSLLTFPSFFGYEYDGSLPMLAILLLSLPWAFLGTARSIVLVLRGWLWTAPLTSAIGAVVNIILNIFLIPRYGGLGAACSTVLSHWLAAHGTSLLLPHLRPTGIAMTKALNPISAAFRLIRLL